MSTGPSLARSATVNFASLTLLKLGSAATPLLFCATSAAPVRFGSPSVTCPFGPTAPERTRVK